MAVDAAQKLHWTQRIALVRHNLHAARRTGDFTFFRMLQAHVLINGTDHVAVLQGMLGDQADSILSTLDNLNAGIAYVHQDAFKAVYDGVKATMYKTGNSPSSRRSLLRVDVSQQRDMADHAIDKTTNSAIHLIEAQPLHSQDAVANAWITGATIIADAVAVCLQQMDEMESWMDDFIRLEYSWTRIQNSVDAAVSALRGIFNLMAGSGSSAGSRSNSNAGLLHRQTSNSSNGVSAASSFTNFIRNPSIALPGPPSLTHLHSDPNQLGSGGSGNSLVPPSAAPPYRGRTSSTAQALGLLKRAFSTSHGMMPPQGPLQLPDANPYGLRLSMSAACPTRMPGPFNTQLNTIPGTPAAVAESTPLPLAPSTVGVGLGVGLADDDGAMVNPFKEKNDYFSFNLGGGAGAAGGEASARSALGGLGADGMSGTPMSEGGPSAEEVMQLFVLLSPYHFTRVCLIHLSASYCLVSLSNGQMLTRVGRESLDPLHSPAVDPAMLGMPPNMDEMPIYGPFGLAHSPIVA